MYIIKNALKCISRSKGRNILIGVIVLVISVSACIGLSIRQAAENARKDTLEDMTITATISFDRMSAMNEIRNEVEAQQTEDNQPPEFDRSQFSQMMGEASSLTLEEYQKYAEAQTVKNFYYTLSASLDGSDSFEAVTNEEETDSDTDTETQNEQNFGGDMMGGNRGGGMERMMGAQSDFSIEGFSSETAMTSFLDGTSSITQGSIFEEGTEAYECIITEELATFNGIEVGGTVIFTNPNNEEETYEFTVVGIYTDSSSNESSFSMMGATSTDPANKIYTSYNALNTLIAASDSVSETQTDENTGREFETAITGTLNGTYVFADVEDYEAFEEEVREMGLDDSYTVSSSDITAFENSLTPLNTLSTMAGYFLIVILVIGAIILVVLNIFNVRERKYEIGVLTAIGMKKGKVALQFLTEIFIVTLAAVIIGVGIGAVSAVPVTNTLLENQVTSQQNNARQIEQNFGRGETGNAPDDMQAPDSNQMPDSKGGNMFMNMLGVNENSYVTEISSAMNFTVVWQMLGIAVLLTLAAGTVSMLFVMRYEPLKILANRD